MVRAIASTFSRWRRVRSSIRVKYEFGCGRELLVQHLACQIWFAVLFELHYFVRIDIDFADVQHSGEHSPVGFVLHQWFNLLLQLTRLLGRVRLVLGEIGHQRRVTAARYCSRTANACRYIALPVSDQALRSDRCIGHLAGFFGYFFELPKIPVNPAKPVKISIKRKAIIMRPLTDF